jgi:ubiquinone/menaquinone biosynthesis C-methylase UbiE
MATEKDGAIVHLEAEERQNPTPAEMFDRYFGPTIFGPWARVLLEHATPLPGERVLDLACGTGTVARQVAPVVGVNAKVVAVDINPDMLAVARSHPAPPGATIEWRVGDASSLDLPDGAFDLALCQQGLQFFPDRAAALREVRRVLTGSGRLVLNVWQALDRHPVFQALCEAEARHLGVALADVATPWSLPDDVQLRALMSEAGFQRVEITAESREAHFPSADRFVELTVLAGAAVVPTFDHEDAAARLALTEAVARETEPILQHYRSGASLVIPTSWLFAVAYGS